MKRSILMLSAVAAILGLLAAPGFAKGEDEDQIQGHIIITGPGLDEPINLSGSYSGFVFSRERHPSPFDRLLRDSGLARFAQGSTGSWTIPPEEATLGPQYEIQLFFDLEATSTPIREDFYPYAAGGPRTYALPGQSIEGAMVPTLWYSAPLDLLTVLIHLGLPSIAPAVASLPPTTPLAPAAAAATRPGAQQRPAHAAPAAATIKSSGWRWLLSLGGLMTLLLVGALSGRGRRAIPTA